MRTNNNNHIGNERAAEKKNNWIIAVTGNRKTSTTQTTKWNENKEERISNRISFFSLPRLLEHSARTMWICSMRKIAKVLRNSTNLLNTSMKSLCCARCFVGCFFLSPVVVVIAVVVVVFYFAASLFFFPCSIYTTYATHFNSNFSLSAFSMQSQWYIFSNLNYVVCSFCIQIKKKKPSMYRREK